MAGSCSWPRRTSTLACCPSRPDTPHNRLFVPVAAAAALGLRPDTSRGRSSPGTPGCPSRHVCWSPRPTPTRLGYGRRAPQLPTRNRRCVYDLLQAAARPSHRTRQVSRGGSRSRLVLHFLGTRNARRSERFPRPRRRSSTPPPSRERPRFPAGPTSSWWPGSLIEHGTRQTCVYSSPSAHTAPHCPPATPAWGRSSSGFSN